MSHGPEANAASPNLTPLLDVVMQLLMFFMISVNFVNEQVSGDVNLPVSSSAIPIDKTEGDVFFLNIKPFRLTDYEKKENDIREYVASNFQTNEPTIHLVGEKFPRKIGELSGLLREKYRDVSKANDDKVNTTIIIRADEKCKYAEVYRVLSMCKDAGFRQMKIRAVTKANTQGE